MDHGGQLDYEDTIMSQVVPDGIDCCDNTPHLEPLTAKAQNLNKINSLNQTEHTAALNNDFGAGLSSQVSSNDNAENEELERHKSRSQEEEEEDIDEVMKDEEEESEASSCQIHCQSPDPVMTDSSYSETGSLLENPFSPGTSPESASPVLQETSCPISPLELSQSEVDFDTGLSCTDGPEHIPATTARNAQSISGPLTTSTVPSEGLTFPNVSDVRPETSPFRLNTFITSDNQTAELFTFTTGHITTVPSCTTKPIPTLMASLDQLALRGDDSCLPQALHQIAEASVRHEDYCLALRCIQLERLYHQRVLDNLNALEQKWESLCTKSSPSLEAHHLDTLRDICQTHTRPNATDAASSSLDFLRLQLQQGDALPSPARHIEGRMENSAEDASCPQTSHPLTPSINLSHRLNSPDSTEKDREDPVCNLEGRASLDWTDLTDEKEGSGRERGERLDHATSAPGNVVHPSEDVQMDQAEPAEQQGGDLGLDLEKEVDREDEGSDVGEAVEALKMEDETEEEEGEEERKVLSGISVEVEHQHQEAQVEGKEDICQEIEEGNESSLQQDDDDDDDAHLPQEALLKHPGLGDEEQEEYEAERADTFRDAITLDDMAKLITVEMSPASGLISILKKRTLPSDNLRLSASVESRSDKPTAKRRVRFKVADDGFDSDVGGRDSCLLLFLLCLVTVVISMGGTTLYCALGDVHSSVCRDFSRNVDFYFGQMQRAVAQLHQWLAPSST
ncbi:consortin isoform X2 [Syngnathoides biaculeatus]|uniref:consortin isoform X2 n=1 Tax=Syngnathoides biaculeatus TaxID=300417 RepID=UPI002ADE0B8E|nr:consortin isoform X2 [Syngnathoides biaculeatus]